MEHASFTSLALAAGAHNKKIVWLVQKHDFCTLFAFYLNQDGNAQIERNIWLDNSFTKLTFICLVNCAFEDLYLNFYIVGNESYVIYIFSSSLVLS